MAPQQPSSARDQVRDIVPALVDLSERVLFGEVWERPGLSKRDRSLITCATLIALGREKQLVGRLRSRRLDLPNESVVGSAHRPRRRERHVHSLKGFYEEQWSFQFKCL